MLGELCSIISSVILEVLGEFYPAASSLMLGDEFCSTALGDFTISLMILNRFDFLV